jgi:hypothetical protein
VFWFVTVKDVCQVRWRIFMLVGDFEGLFRLNSDSRKQFLHHDITYPILVAVTLFIRICRLMRFNIPIQFQSHSSKCHRQRGRQNGKSGSREREPHVFIVTNVIFDYLSTHLCSRWFWYPTCSTLALMSKKFYLFWCYAFYMCYLLPHQIKHFF